jgi:hypothetical protein
MPGNSLACGFLKKKADLYVVHSYAILKESHCVPFLLYLVLWCALDDFCNHICLIILHLMVLVIHNIYNRRNRKRCQLPTTSFIDVQIIGGLD